MAAQWDKGRMRWHYHCGRRNLAPRRAFCRRSGRPIDMVMLFLKKKKKKKKKSGPRGFGCNYIIG